MTSLTPPLAGRVVALASGKGGVGRTTLAVELAQAFKRLGLRTLIVDLDYLNANVATLLESQPPGENQFTALKSGIWLASATPESLTTPFWPEETFDWIILDLPSGSSSELLRLFVEADVSILVTIPEPTALIAADTFLKKLIRHHVCECDDLGEPFHDYLDLSEELWSFQRALEVSSAPKTLVRSLGELRLGLVLNQVRESSEWEQVNALCHGWSLKHGIWPSPLTPMRHDDRRWFYARRLAPPSVHSREESLQGDADHLAEALNDLSQDQWFAARPCLAALNPERECRPFLRTTHMESAEPRQRYRRLWEGYRRENGLVSYVFDNDLRGAGLEKLERAFRQLTLEPPEEEALETLKVRPGEILRVAREQLGLGQRELSQRTRVGVKHIAAIEEMNLDDLPVRVYLKAYLSEIARTLRLDPTRLVNEYLEALEEDE